MSMPTDLMMRYPPMEVPSDITREQRIINHMGIAKLLTSPCPLERKIPNKNTLINFCPSCAPCMNAMEAAPAIWPPGKTRWSFADPCAGKSTR